MIINSHKHINKINTPFNKLPCARKHLHVGQKFLHLKTNRANVMITSCTGEHLNIKPK